MKSITNKINKGLQYLLIFLMSIMTINVLWQVFSRYVLGSPSPFTEELARYLMIWLGLFGAAYVAGKDAHVAINVLPSKFSNKTQKRLKIFIAILIMIFALSTMVIGGIRLVFITYYLEQFSPALGIPLAVVYAAVPLSGLLIIYYKTTNHLISHK